MKTYINVQIKGLQTFYGKGPHRLLWAGGQAARGIANHPNYCDVFIAYTQLTNVAAGWRHSAQNNTQLRSNVYNNTSTILSVTHFSDGLLHLALSHPFTTHRSDQR